MNFNNTELIDTELIELMHNFDVDKKYNRLIDPNYLVDLLREEIDNYYNFFNRSKSFLFAIVYALLVMQSQDNPENTKELNGINYTYFPKIEKIMSVKEIPDYGITISEEFSFIKVFSILEYISYKKIVEHPEEKNVCITKEDIENFRNQKHNSSNIEKPKSKKKHFWQKR